MNLFNALGFFTLGLAMMMLPDVVSLSPPTAALGDVADSWLKFMGCLMFLIGSGGIAKSLAAAWPKQVRMPKASAMLSDAQAGTRSTLASTANRAAF